MAYELRLTLGLVIRGPAGAIQILVPALEGLLASHPDVYILRREVSDRQIWLNVGREPESRRTSEDYDSVPGYCRRCRRQAATIYVDGQGWLCAACAAPEARQ